MREMTATEASRHFGEVHDGVEHGETITATRGGHRVAETSLALSANGGALRAVMERWRGEQALDAAFEAEVLAAEGSVSDEQDADPFSPATTAGKGGGGRRSWGISGPCGSSGAARGTPRR